MAETFEAADRLDAPLVVVHAGTFTTSDPGPAFERFSEFTDRWSDPRLVVENLPVTFRGVRMLGNTGADLAGLISGTKLGICLDFSHLYCSSVSLDLPFKDILSEFRPLPVKYHHLTKSGPRGERDEHRGLDDPRGDLPVKDVLTWIRARPDVPTALEYKKGGAYNRRQAEIFTALLQGK
jgi:endonuclease IV